MSNSDKKEDKPDPDMDLSYLRVECTIKYSEAHTWLKAQDLLVQTSLNIL